MSKRVDPTTMVCFAHDVQGCAVCMTDDFHDWCCKRAERRRQYKLEWKQTLVHERFDLGGEG